MGKKVSLIVAAYNVEKYIEKCIKSIIGQSYKNLEIILVNDGSTDGTFVICEKLKESDSRIIIIDRENGGLSAARNSGLDIASGDFIAFVDGDDYIEKTYCEELVSESEKNNSDVILFTYYRDYGDRIVPVFADGSGYLMDREQAIKELVLNERVKSMACMKFYRAFLFKDIRFKEGVGYEDVYIMHQIFMKAERFYVYSVALYYYLFRADSISNVQSESNLYHRFNSLKIRFRDLLSEYPDLKELLIEKTAYSFVDIFNSMEAGKYSDEKGVLPGIRNFFKENKKEISLKIRFMFSVVKIAGKLNLSNLLHKMMVKLINS